MVQETDEPIHDAIQSASDPVYTSRRPSPIAWMAIAVVGGYKRWISPMLGNNCRFHPTCSEYYVLAVRRYGFTWGTLKGMGRIFRCHPFHPGGVDFP